ncbi:MAG: hypothetical protein K1X28_06460 [Parachlamydiales bacterium]|nr:hypothetical protein [Parachlamydiales bacterium]
MSSIDGNFYKQLGLPINPSPEQIEAKAQELDREAVFFSYDCERSARTIDYVAHKKDTLARKIHNTNLSIDLRMNDLTDSLKSVWLSYRRLLKTFFSGESRSEIQRNNEFFIDEYSQDISDLIKQKGKALTISTLASVHAEALRSILSK